MEKVLRNPTLYSKALTANELAPAFKWHGYAHSPRSSQAFCISAFGTLRNLTVGNRVVASLLSEAFPLIATAGRPRNWTISPESENEELLNEKGTVQSTSVDVLCTSSQEVVCIESKFVTDAAKGFDSCGQVSKGHCAGFYGPGSDKKRGTKAWCRLESWDGKRSPRLYWTLGKSYFSTNVFERQLQGQSCPFSGPTYQLMRNFLFAARMAERDRKSFFGVLAICPENFSGVLGSQVAEFQQNVLRPEFRGRVKFLNYETLITHLRLVDDEEASALAEYLEERIDTVCVKGSV